MINSRESVDVLIENAAGCIVVVRPCWVFLVTSNVTLGSVRDLDACLGLPDRFPPVKVLGPKSSYGLRQGWPPCSVQINLGSYA